jgi:predicted AlkP superfamily pyrophosphatase or phosphodiesterase
MKKIFFFFLLLISVSAFAQKTSSNSRPKLVVGIVVDQMRYDYLFRFWDKYSDDGFKRLVNNGFLMKDANYNYVPTYTGPGHACIYTGTTPAYNGIVSNDWFDRAANKTTYCASDGMVKSIGTDSATGKMSPSKLLTSTITDELRLSNNFKSKVIGISLKDRGAILPAGHTANAAYWHDPNTNNFVTSSYYMNDLPQWVKDFNNRKIVDSLLKSPWTTLLPIESYTESTADANRYEGMYSGETGSVFPHNLPAIKGADRELIRRTPFGNTYLKLFAEAAINGENLGSDNTDFLCMSFSSTDYVGHMFGSNSIELEDTYIRLDRELASFLSFLDKKVGAGNYVLFLTADHGGASNQNFNEDMRIPAGRFNDSAQTASLKSFLNQQFGEGDYISYAEAHGVYLNYSTIYSKHLSLEEVEARCINYILTLPGVATALSGEEMKKGNCKTGLALFMQNGFNPQRSADIMIELSPSWLDWGYKTGTTHGSAYSYDTHVPVLFYGWHVSHGSSTAPVSITDIAPTIAAMLSIENPSGCTGKPIQELAK